MDLPGSMELFYYTDKELIFMSVTAPLAKSHLLRQHIAALPDLEMEFVLLPLVFFFTSSKC